MKVLLYEITRVRVLRTLQQEKEETLQKVE